MGDLIELGKRAAACKHWKWMPGMVDIYGSRFLNHDVGGGRWWIAWGEDGTCLDEARDDDTPDLSDPATLGCILHLVLALNEGGSPFAMFGDRQDAESLVRCLENQGD